jgi:predicted dithiol-disulfide oxidoreductase (DUF899 family)
MSDKLVVLRTKMGWGDILALSMFAMKFDIDDRVSYNQDQGP